MRSGLRWDCRSRQGWGCTLRLCDHAECYKEVEAQAISYTTGVPAMLGGAMILKGIWKGEGVFNMEQFDPDPFMAEIGKWGLPWKELFETKLV